MRREHVRYLRCPSCQVELDVVDAIESDGRIRAGRLCCRSCGASYPIVRHVPRFVSESNYAESFGIEWNLHARTQYDLTSGIAASEARFFEETGWPRSLEGETVVEAGSGSGRFTEQALDTGAMVLSLDYSSAVDANYASNGHRDNLLLVQGDLFDMPFARGVADRLFCFGVIQHTPDPRGGLASLASLVRPGGCLVVDIYAKTFSQYVLGTKYWVRPLTIRIAPEKLYRLISRYVDVMWPLARLLRRVPKIGRALNWRLLIADYSDLTSDDAVLREWARLDTFDMLSPRFDKPATLATVRRWCADLRLASFHVQPGYNGLEIHARR